jgi:hypothetical protein
MPHRQALAKCRGRYVCSYVRLAFAMVNFIGRCVRRCTTDTCRACTRP